MRRGILAAVLLLLITYAVSANGHFIFFGAKGTSGNDGYTTFLVHSDTVSGSSVFVDVGRGSGCPHAIYTVKDIQHSTTQAKFGTSSVSSDGIADYLWCNDDDGFDFPGDFTIDTWIYMDSVNNTGSVVANIIAHHGRPWNGGETDAWYFAVCDPASSGVTKLAFVTGNGFGGYESIVESANGAITTKKWYHVAVTREGSTITLWIDGTAVDTDTSGTGTTNFNSGVTLGWMCDYDLARSFEGFIDEPRISKGIARADFPATRQYD